MTFKKNIKTHMILSAGLSALLGTTTLSAQQRTEVAEVPFTFHAQQQTFPAGEYQVTQKNSGSVFQLMSSEGKSIYLNAQLLNTTDPQRPHLTFARYGGEYVLSAISMPGTDIGHAVSQSAIDKNLTQKMGLAAMISVSLKAR
jgi:hypothetical protein